MEGYRITDRGKMVVAVLLVLIVLVIPSVIISVNAALRESPQDDTPEAAEVAPQPGEDPSDGIAERPPPHGNGLHPELRPEGDQGDEYPENANGIGNAAEEGNGMPNPADTSDSSDSGDDVQYDPPERGLVGLDVAAGTMAFIFFPDTQDALDEETALAVVEFLASPRNTETSRIIVQFPQLPETVRLNIVNAVTAELTRHGVSRQDIVFFTTNETLVGDSFEVSMAFHFHQPPTNNDK